MQSYVIARTDPGPGSAMGPGSAQLGPFESRAEAERQREHQELDRRTEAWVVEPGAWVRFRSENGEEARGFLVQPGKSGPGFWVISLQLGASRRRRRSLLTPRDVILGVRLPELVEGI